MKAHPKVKQVAVHLPAAAVVIASDDEKAVGLHVQPRELAQRGDRVLDLQRHFGQANDDIEKILTSSEKITKRGRKIETLDFEDEAQAELAKKNGGARPQVAPAQPAPSTQPAPAQPARREGPRIIRQPDLLAGE